MKRKFRIKGYVEFSVFKNFFGDDVKYDDAFLNYEDIWYIVTILATPEKMSLFLLEHSENLDTVEEVSLSFKEKMRCWIDEIRSFCYFKTR